MLLQGSTLLLVLIYSSFTSQASVDDNIRRWRNQESGNIQYRRGTQVGLGDEIHRTRVTAQVEMARCIEDERRRGGGDEESGILYIDKAFEYFGKCFCKKVLLRDQSCKGATVNYAQTDLQYRHFYRFRIQKSFGSIRYFEQQNLPEKKENIFIKTITNRGSKKVQSNAEITIVKTDSSSTTSSSEAGGSLGASVNINAGVVSVKTNIEQSYSKSGSMTNKTETKSTFSLNRAFDIPPNSAVQIICSLKNQAFDLKWEIPVNITGAVAVKSLDEQGKDEFLFVDVQHIAPYFKEFSLIEGTLQTFIRGRTQGNKHYSAEVNPQAMPLENPVITKDVCNPKPSVE